MCDQSKGLVFAYHHWSCFLQWPSRKKDHRMTDTFPMPGTSSSGSIATVPLSHTWEYSRIHTCILYPLISGKNLDGDMHSFHHDKSWWWLFFLFFMVVDIFGPASSSHDKLVIILFCIRVTMTFMRNLTARLHFCVEKTGWYL